jgi:CRP/FNR family transcriptional regulator, dissimilatory nitrate respiration regulator
MHNANMELSSLEPVLRRIPMLATLPGPVLGELLALAVPAPLHKGEVLFSEGEPAAFLPLLLSGRVKLYRSDAEGREQVIHLVRAPASFGEAAVFGPGVFPATAEVLEDGTLLQVPRDVLLDLLRRRPEVCLALLASLSAWLRRLVDLVDSLSLATVEQRVAGYLWATVTRAAPNPGSGTAVHLEDPKHVIAALCGTAPAVLSRTFRKLEQAGLIRVDGATVTVFDPTGLAALARRE